MPETIGQQLKQARETRNLTIEKVVQATRLRAHHIEALEADDFESLPSPVQVRAFLRIYAEFLGLSLDGLIDRQRAGAEQNEQKQDAQKQNAKKQKQAEETVQATDAEVEPGGEPDVSKAVPLKDRARRIIGDAKKLVPGRKKAPASPEPASSAPSSAASPEENQEEPVPAAPPTPAGQEDEPDYPEGVSSTSTSASAGKQESLAIFASIGAALRQRRETLSLTLDEVEQHTHVRQHYLQALEAGEFQLLPSSVQTRGMLHNYASFLNMDMEAILSQFAEGLQRQRLERQAKLFEKPSQANSKPSFKNILPANLRRYLSMDILFGSGLILLLIGFAIWGTARVIGTRSSAEPEGTAPSISDILGNAPAEGTALTSVSTEQAEAAVALLPTANETVTATMPAAGQGAVQVVVVAHQSAWVRVTVDGQQQFEGRVTEGKAYSYDGNTQIQVLTGDGSAIGILYNQSDLGAMGTFGQVVDRIYTVNGIVNPTPTPTLTPTITPQPSPTPSPSRTPKGGG